MTNRHSKGNDHGYRRHRRQRSLDGYLAGPAESGCEHLFDWYHNGDVTVGTSHAELTMRLGWASAAYFRSAIEDTGALVMGRRLFDLTDG